MAAATDSLVTFGRIAVLGNVASVLCTITASATTYTAASGGLPIDLAAILNMMGGAAPFSLPNINPSDVVSVSGNFTSTPGKYQATDLAIGTPTYVAAAYPFGGGSINAIHPVQQLSTCPATIRLFGKAGGASGEFADGACSETVQFLLVIARGGVNIN